MKPKATIPSKAIRSWLRRMDRIGDMPRLHWEAYLYRGRPQLIRKGGKP